MSQYMIDAIRNGVWETLQMTFFASLYSYLIGLPLGVILYATSKGRIPRDTCPLICLILAS